MSWIPHHALVAPDGESPAGWLVFLHGILGSGANWRTIARRLVSARPDWGAVLVDLRMHGRSQDAPPPHSLAQVAADLERLAAHLEGRGTRVAGVIGHSFGGKAALAYRARAPRGLVETWVLDATPSARPEALRRRPAGAGARPEGAVEVVRMLEELPGQFSSREEFLDQLAGRGTSRPLAEWLAMNLERVSDRYRLRLDLAAIGALLADYHHQDLWPAVESPELPGAVRFVVAGRSSAVSGDDRRRLEELAPVAAALRTYSLPEAGHWLNLDAPDRLLALFTEELARPPLA